MREADGDALGLGSQVLTKLWGRDQAAGGDERWEGGRAARETALQFVKTRLHVKCCCFSSQ